MTRHIPALQRERGNGNDGLEGITLDTHDEIRKRLSSLSDQKTNRPRQSHHSYVLGPLLAR
jgi:hypothetical protein